MNLVDTIKKSLRGVAAYVAPVTTGYDWKTEADELLKDPYVQAITFEQEALKPYLEQAAYENSLLLYSAKTADTADKWTSLLGLLGESIGLGAGGLPGVGINIVEETIETIFKIPVYYELARRKDLRSHIRPLIEREAATYVVPVAGDVYDIVRNLYVSKAHEIIREEAKAAFLQDQNPTT